MSEHIPFLTFLVGLGAFGVLIWYAFETMKLRRVAMEQVESMAKPCLTLSAELRDQADAILDTGGAVGNMVIKSNDAQFLVQNVGTGMRPDNPRYLFYMLVNQRVQLPEPINASPYVGNCEAVFRYQSVSGRWYQSIVTMDNHVRAKFDFRPLKTRPY